METEKSRKDIIKEIEVFLEKQFGTAVARTGLPRSIDIHCKKDGKDTYFCVMAVSFDKKKNTYFDATVSAEWEFIKEQREKGVAVWYVIYRKDIEDQDKRIVLLTPEQVLVCSMPYLQSFHIKLNITKEELENPKIMDGRKPKVNEKKLYDAIRRYNKIKDSFKK